jgi:hypothetical protein
MKTLFVLILLSAAVWAEEKVLVAPPDETARVAQDDGVLVAQGKRKPDVTGAAVGGREIASTADLYAAVPGEAKKSQVVGGMVKSYTGEIDLICGQASKICVITFKNKK